LGLLDFLSDEGNSYDAASSVATSVEYGAELYRSHADKRDLKQLNSLRQPFSRYPKQQLRIIQGIEGRSDLIKGFSKVVGKPLFILGVAIEADNFWDNVNAKCLCEKEK
jgi:hypothetical protein